MMLTSHPRYRLLITCVFILFALIGLWLPTQLGVVQAAPGSTITVNSPTDILADDGVCTLREAITAANTDTPSGTSTGECAAGNGADTIVFSDTHAPFTVTLALTGTREDENATGDLDIFSDITIQGNPNFTTTIDANQLDRVLDVLTGTVAIQNVYFLNGRTPDGPSSDTPPTSGGTAEGGGAIRNQDYLNLNEVVLIDNHTGNGGDLVQNFNRTGGNNNGGDGGNGGAIYNSGTLDLENVAFMDNKTGRGGDVTAWSQSSSGGNGGNGGGLYNSGNATLANVLFEANHTGRGGSGLIILPCPASVAGGCGGSGGGIFSSGSLTLTTVEIQSSVTGAGGQGVGIIYADDQGGAGGNGGVGGGIYVEGVLAANDLRVWGNITGNGGDGALVLGDIGGDGGNGGHGAGLYLNLNSQTQPLLQKIQSFDNQTGRGGLGGSCLGPICDNSQSGNGGNGAGLVNITEGTILEQSAIFSNVTGVGGGGAPWVLPGEAGNGGGVWTMGGFSLVASTISSNTTPQTAKGGGVFFSDGTQLSTFVHSTIANNQSLSGAGGGLYGNGYVNFANSILSDNQATTHPDCVMVLISQGYNIIENTDGCTITGTTPSDQLNVDPQLAPLDGTIHPLLSTSPALDAGLCFGATSDQRGLPRPVDLPQPNLADGCDIGAYEEQVAIATPTPTPSATNVPFTPTPLATNVPSTSTVTATATIVPATYTPTATSVPPTLTATATLPNESGYALYLPLVQQESMRP
jgi:CSLREA domain-containing protein